MTERDAHIRGILTDPHDDLRRLVFADWLDENGEPERAEFIRVQCALAKATPWPSLPSSDMYVYQFDFRHGEGFVVIGGVDAKIVAALPANGQAFDLSLAPEERRRWSSSTGKRLSRWKQNWHNLLAKEVDRHEGRWGIRFVLNPGPDDPFRKAREREAELLESHNRTWFYPVREQVVHYEVTCGFVSEVRLSLAAFMGGECERCGCTVCDNTDCTEGLAKAIFSAHPVTKVVLTDRTPRHEPGVGGVWHRSDSSTQPTEHDLPDFLFDRLAGYTATNTIEHARFTPAVVRDEKYFPDTIAAADSLSAVLVAHGRELAGLPALVEATCPA